MKTRGNQTGFSQVEILVVIALMVIVALISVPTFKSLLAKKRLAAVATQLQSNLMAMRWEAISQRSWMSLQVENDHQYTMYRDANKNRINDPGETITVRDLHLNAPDVAMSLSAGDTVTFYPNGTLGTAPATLCLTGASGLNPKKIRLNITGRVSLEDAASCP